MDDDPRTFAIIGAAMFTHSELGAGYLEMTYQSALEKVFRKRGIPYQREVPIRIWFLGEQLDGTFRADFVCYDEIVVELKAIPGLGRPEVSQLAHYLTATGLPLGLLLNFGADSLQFQRVVPRRSTKVGPYRTPGGLREEAERLELERSRSESGESAESPVPHAGSDQSTSRVRPTVS